MKKLITLLAFFIVATKIHAQTVANVEGVYGGSISSITGGKVGSATDTFRIFVATQSANSIFYSTTIVPSSGAPATIDSFRVLTAASSASGFGSGINKLAYHNTSGKVFFISIGTVYSASTSSTSASTIPSLNGIADIAIAGNNFFALSSAMPDNIVYAGTLDASGNLTINSATTIIGQAYSNLVLGKNNKLYLFKAGSDPQAVEFGGNISSGVNFSTTTINNLSSLSSSVQWGAMAVYSDGTVYIGGNDNTGKIMASASGFTGSYTSSSIGIAGISGSNIEFRTVNASSYYVYFGSAYNTNNGSAGSWFNIGNTSFETHPNDGPVFFVKNHLTSGGVLLMTTDQGLGITKNSGSVIVEADLGINAVQVKDFDMNTSKDFGWLASKSGIRYVENYNTTAKAWSKALFPNGDGSPYYSCEMVSNDTAYVGNSRIYKTNDKGNTWTQLFDANQTPYNLLGATVSTIAIGGTNNQIVMVGYKQLTGNSKGGVFYSLNGGTSWQQLLINATSMGQDVNVNDIEMTIDSGMVVAYIGVNYSSTTSPITTGMYKVKYNGTTWAVSSEPIYNSSSALISINDIAIVSKDTIVAVGAYYNSVLKHEYPISFSISRAVKNTWSSAVVDTSRVGGYKAVSWSGDTLFYAYNNIIYWDRIQFNTTYTYRRGEAEYYSVPVGTEVNVLFYDELVAGTETDIRSIRGASTIRTPIRTTTHRSACSGGVITGGTPAGGYYYIVDTLADAYVRGTNGEYYVMFAANGVLTGESSTSFESLSSVVATFPTLTLTYFTTITTYPNAGGTYVIGYTDAGFSGVSATDTTTVTSSPTVSAISGANHSCNGQGATTQLSNTTSGGVWSSSNASIAIINATTGLLTVKGFGTTVINYTINSGVCNNAATMNFTVAGLPMLDTISGSNNVCVGNSIQLANNSFLPVGTSTNWSSITGRATISATGLVTGTSAGTATIKYTATNTYGCSSYTTKYVTVSALPAIPGIAYASGTPSPQTTSVGGVMQLCSNKNFNLVGNPVNGIWSKTGNISVSPLGVNSSTVNISTFGALGNVSVTYTITNNKGCSNSRTISANVVNCGSRGMNSKIASENEAFVLYPNPATENITVVTTDIKEIIIVDLMGKILFSKKYSNDNKAQISLNNFKVGVYFVKVINAKDEIKISKLFKE